MLMALATRLICAWFAFLLPAYSTWKALSHRPLSEPELEKLAKYWTCIGAIIAFENVAEWFISWFPFYWELRMVFLLFLALPQTSGSTWVYQTYLDPYFQKNEADIDASIVAAQSKGLTFVQEKGTAAWDAVWRAATKSAVTGPQASTSTPGQTPSQPTQQPPANILSMGTDLFHKYGPWAMGAIQSSLGAAQTRASGPANAGQPGPLPTPPANPTPNPSLHQRSPFASTENVATPSKPPSFPEPFQ
ncbi:HVA22/TB2/DP1 family protein [Phanerochaete sordida]|uniref:Protein YOP1 n=1 Tax=Phanerochaete sordida TaxID=48140 RepID=A0A9P3L9A5_9APHY|nr:HVA22/TB2/DP1 family protein [Phanerochaete sordida]